MSRKEKRKGIKKMKRKQARKDIALKQLQEQEEEDPQDLILIEQEEAKRSEAVRLIFEDRERAWLQAMEMRNKKQQEELGIKALEEEQQIENANEDGDDDEWEYVEEGPAEIVYKGNEITIKKKRVKVPKRNKVQQEDSHRPTSNPLPPQSQAFDDHKNSSLSAQQLIETVAEQVPHFGTEQDKDHCPFHLKTGACRFGQHCSRVHFYPDKSSTLLIKNMYNGPGLTWEHDEGLEYTDEEIERCYEEFYEDVHTEFLKFGEIINFKVCINGASHLRGNVYVQYSALESALVAHQSINGRYFAGKQISCDFINVTRWKVAICGEYVKSRYKTCSRGSACNFIHCFRNPGGDYEWADSDRPPPKYWVEKMVALFGYSDAYQKQIMEDNTGQMKNTRMSMTDSRRYVVQRSSSRDRSYSSFTGSGRRYDNEYYAPKGTSHQRPSGEESTYLKDYNHRKNRKYYIESDGEFLDTDGDMDRDIYHDHKRKSSRQENRDQKNKTSETESDEHLLERGRNRLTEHCSTRKSSSQQGKAGVRCDYVDCEKKVHEVGGDRSTRDKDRESYHDSRRSSGHKRKVGYDHKDHKCKAQDSDGEWSDSIRRGEEHHAIRKSLVHIGNSSKGSKERESSGWSSTAELSEDLLDKDAEKDTGHANKQSKHWDKVADDNQSAAQDVKHTRGHLSLNTKEADSPVKISKSYDNIDKQDRREPEHNSEVKAGNSESHELSDFVSKLYCDDKVGKVEHRYEAGEVTSSKHQKSRRLSAKSNGERDNGKRSRGSSKSGYRRRSNSSDDVTDSSEDNKETSILNKHYAIHRKLNQVAWYRLDSPA
ncbi:hypothetical protein ACLB2K_050442 [Fragaria x ananassa]